MSRVVLDTNVIVSALLVPAGTQASVLLLAFRGQIALYVSAPVLDEYEEVLRRPRFRLEPREIEAAPREIRKVGQVVEPNAVKFSGRVSSQTFHSGYVWRGTITGRATVPVAPG